MVSRTYTLKPGGKHHRKEEGGVKIYMPGDSIKLTEREAEAIKDRLVFDLTPGPLVEAKAPKETLESLVMKQIAGGKFNVVNPSTGKNVNENPLTKVEAEVLIGD